MKRLMGICIIMAVMLTLAVVPAVAAPPECTQGDTADLSASSIPGSCLSFTISNPGNWGGEPDNRVVTAFPGDLDDAGYCTLNVTEGKKACRIELQVLDGIADDSFNVYVMNPGGDWTLVYSYICDPSTSEFWEVHNIYGFPAGKGQGKGAQGTEVKIKIEPTNVGWSGFNTYGQLAVDYIAIYERWLATASHREERLHRGRSSLLEGFNKNGSGNRHSTPGNTGHFGH